MDTWMLILSAITFVICVTTIFVSLRSLRSMASQRSPSESQAVQTDAERCVLQYGDGDKALVIVLGTLLPASVLYLYVANQLDPLWALAVLMLDMLVVGYGGLEFFKTRIEFDAKYVYTFSPWRKPRVIPWAVIMSCKYSPIRKWNTFDTFGYGSLRVSDLMEGKDAFLAKFKRHGEECTEYSQAHTAV